MQVLVNIILSSNDHRKAIAAADLYGKDYKAKKTFGVHRFYSETIHFEKKAASPPSVGHSVNSPFCQILQASVGM